MEKKYNPEDYMPKTESEQNRAFETSTEILEVSTSAPSENSRTTDAEQSSTSPVRTPRTDPEIDGSDIDTEAPGTWARMVSAFFSPLLIPTYCVALAMWLTPLSHLSENTRLLATIVVLAITALIPTACMAALIRTGHRPGFEYANRSSRLIPALMFAICQVAGAFYLYYSYAPEWLVMIPVAGACTTIAFVAANFFVYLSGHTMAMASLCAVLIYLGRTGLSEVPLTFWLIVVVLLSGLVGGARLELKRHSPREIIIGYILGFVVTYAALCVHILDPRTKPVEI